MRSKSSTYIPALRFNWLTSFYDPIIRLTMREMTFKRELLRQIHIKKSYRVLDLGCGTAVLTIMIKQAHPDADVVGLDGDPSVLAIAKEKVNKARLQIAFHEGMAFELPYPEGTFDRVVSSLMFHHLTHENKLRALKEVYRVLRFDGELLVADFGKPHTPLMYPASLIVQHLEEASDNVKGLLPQMFRDAGFHQIAQLNQYSTLLGTVSLFRACKLEISPSSPIS